MKLKYNGHSCFTLTFSDGTVLVTDPFDASVTYTPCTDECTVALLSHDHFDHNYTGSLRGDFRVIREAGSYTVGQTRITMIPSFHDEVCGAKRGKNLIARIEGDGITIAHLGDLGHMPDDTQIAALENIDVLMIPIGGTFTIDTEAAEEVIAMLKPRVALGMHYQTPDYGADHFALPDRFAADMNAARLPREVELTPEGIGTMPSAVLMAYK